MFENIIVREDVDKYMSELREWLAETADDPAEEMSDFFAARLEGYEDHICPWREDYRILAETLPEGIQTLLDLGCGTGLELDEIFPRFPGLSVTGIDISAAMLNRFREKHPDKRIDFIEGDYFSVDFGSDFDCAVAFQTLHHFAAERKYELFCKIYCALKAGGSFIYTDYFACCDEEERLLSREYSRRCGDLPAGRYVHFDIPLTLPHEAEMLQRAGFSVTARSVPNAVMVTAKK